MNIPIPLIKTGDLLVRSLRKEDWGHVSKIYQQGIDTGNATFETRVPDWTHWDQHHIKNCRLVAEINNTIAGWAALTAVSSRCVYGGVAEVSVYVSNEFKGRNIGSMLLNRLITESEISGFWTLQASIFPENKVSIMMHERAGFRRMGYREKIGQMNGVWRDTIIFERRSDRVGV